MNNTSTSGQMQLQESATSSYLCEAIFITTVIFEHRPVTTKVNTTFYSLRWKKVFLHLILLKSF